MEAVRGLMEIESHKWEHLRGDVLTFLGQARS